mmetsp:Transcript_1831/g.3273  ORF Transcript_1831/g.3273 Transcript_1831/m.3273 type:complete len:157 (-) Transcript_1831:108-578(-)
MVVVDQHLGFLNCASALKNSQRLSNTSSLCSLSNNSVVVNRVLRRGAARRVCICASYSRKMGTSDSDQSMDGNTGYDEYSRSIECIVNDAMRAFAMYKPAWYQPYTIIPAGCLLIAASWTLARGVPAVLTTGSVWLWWFISLVEYPRFVLGKTLDE